MSYLENLLILLCVGVLHLLRGCNVVFEVTTGMFPGLEALEEELGDLKHVSDLRSSQMLTSREQTSLVSSSGMASLSVLLVAVRVGRLWEAIL